MKLLLATTALLFSFVTYAYEISTHAVMTQKAFERSVLNVSNPNSILQTLGFERLDINKTFDLDRPVLFNAGISDRAFYDEATRLPNVPDRVIRLPQEQERTSMQLLLERGFVPGFSSVDQLEGSVNGWLMRGAIREDDNDGRKSPLGIPSSTVRPLNFAIFAGF